MDSAPIAYSIKDACAASGIGRTVLYRLLAAGDIVAVKLGQKTLVKADSLRSYVAGLPRAEIGREAAWALRNDRLHPLRYVTTRPMSIVT